MQLVSKSVGSVSKYDMRRVKQERIRESALKVDLSRQMTSLRVTLVEQWVPKPNKLVHGSLVHVYL